MLHRKEVHVEKSIDAVCQAAFFSSIKLGILDVASNAFLPADLGQAMGLCTIQRRLAEWPSYPKGTLRRGERMGRERTYISRQPESSSDVDKTSWTVIKMATGWTRNRAAMNKLT